MFLDIDGTMDNVQKHDICAHVPSSQTFRSHLTKLHFFFYGSLYFKTYHTPYTQDNGELYCTMIRYFDVVCFQQFPTEISTSC
jgi:hypothetical protein